MIRNNYLYFFSSLFLSDIKRIVHIMITDTMDRDRISH